MQTILLKKNLTITRKIVVLYSDWAGHKELLNNKIEVYKDDILILSERKGINAINPALYKKYLGSEKLCVILDLTSGFNADSFAATSSVVVGGGAFILLLPEKDECNKVFKNSFSSRLLNFIDNSEFITAQKSSEIIAIKSTHYPLSELEHEYSATKEQKSVITEINNNFKSKKTGNLVITADRGRGKSAALGMACAEMLFSGNKNIAIVAPRLDATRIIFKHIAAALPDADITRGKCTCNQSQVNFYAPDLFLLEKVKPDYLFIDEAATIPVPVLMKLVSSSAHCVISTTVHGYEGTGRGFQFRFIPWLKKFNENTKSVQLKKPVRWSENDVLEAWVFNLFCLDAEVKKPEIELSEYNQIEYIEISKQRLHDNEFLLRQAFALLVTAHYRTRPSDLQYLLEQDCVSVYLAIYNEIPVAVALVNHEGDFSEELSTQVYRGERRPTGHLLAQSLSYHCGIKKAATLSCSRIMRIAVHPDLQGNKIGSKLVDLIRVEENKKGSDVLGTSFGLNQQLFNFWKKLDFSIVRIGFKREQVSGEHSGLMITALSGKGKDTVKLAEERFYRKLPYWKNDVLSDFYGEKISSINPFNKIAKHNLFWKQELTDYLEYSRSYELTIDVIQEFYMKNSFIDELTDIEKNVLHARIVKNLSWKYIAELFEFSGKAEASKFFKNTIRKLFLLSTE